MELFTKGRVQSAIWSLLQQSTPRPSRIIKEFTSCLYRSGSYVTDLETACTTENKNFKLNPMFQLLAWFKIISSPSSTSVIEAILPGEAQLGCLKKHIAEILFTVTGRLL